MGNVQQPTLAQKAGAAIYVMSMWPELPGVGTINTLMWPYQAPPMHTMPESPNVRGPWIREPDDVRRQAAKVLASVCTELLAGVPQPRIEQIWTEQAEYLSSAVDAELPDERNPKTLEGVVHPPANIAEWRQAFSGPYHHCRQDSAGGSGA
jgi:hypothetical protein